MSETEIDTSNSQLVGVLGDDIVVMMPQQRMTKFEALLHAAWLVALADDNGDFTDILQAVERT